MMLRRTPLKRSETLRLARWNRIPELTRQALILRSGGICEARLYGCRYYATDPQHRITQKMGGRHGATRVEHDQLVNLLHLCRACHDWVTARPVEAGEIGLSLREHMVPVHEPVVYRGELCLLTNDGQVIVCEVPAT